MLGASLLAMGCAAPGRPGAPPPVPAQAALPLQPWWRGLGDAGLSQRIERALQRNAELGVAAARVREAHALLAEAQGGRQPALAVLAESSRSRPSAEAAAGPGPGLSTLHGVGLVARYEVDLWGRLDAASESARARLGAEQWARSALAWSVSIQVAELHLGLAALARQLEIAASVGDGRGQALALRREELAFGAASEFDVGRAEAELAAAEATLAALRRRQLKLATALSLLVGDAELPTATPALDDSAARAPRLPAGELGELLARRPDVLQQRLLLAASGAGIRASRAARLPALQLSGRLGSDVRELGNLFSAPGMAWALAGSLGQSLFDGGRSAARVEQAQARDDAQQARLGQALLQAATEAREAMQALEIRQQSLDASRRRSAALAHTLGLARVARAAGALSRLDELDAERQLFLSQLDEVDALLQQRLGELAVYKALASGPDGAQS